MLRKSTSVAKPIPTATLHGIIDICTDDKGKPVFLVYDDWTLDIKTSIEVDGVTYVPPPRESMPWLLPHANEVIGYYHSDDDQNLFADIETAIRNNSELPDDGLYPFLASWVLHTHLIDKFNYSPILIFYAVQSRGKTRTCRILLWMARRGVHVESFREADIIRKSERFGCAFIFDIMDVWKKAERMGAEDILLGRFDKGITVPRVTKPELNGFGDTQHFSCFGPTLIATNEPAHRILDSRGIVITMRQAARGFENDPREPDFLALRERAIAFRARWLIKDLPDVSKPSADRLGDILRPIAQTFAVVVPEKLSEFFSLVRSFETERADAQADSPEGQVIKALLALENRVVQGKLKTQEIVDLLNEGKPERYRTTAGSVGKRLAALGFVSTKIRGHRGICYDEALLHKLAVQYGHAPQETVQSVQSVEGSSNAASDDDGAAATDGGLSYETPHHGGNASPASASCQVGSNDRYNVTADRTDRTDIYGEQQQEIDDSEIEKTVCQIEAILGARRMVP